MTKGFISVIINSVVETMTKTFIGNGYTFGSIAQLGERLPYKQDVTGSSPVTPTTLGPVVQLVRTPACHAGGREFEPHPGRQYAFVAQSVEQGTENPCVGGSIPPEGIYAGVAQW